MALLNILNLRNSYLYPGQIITPSDTQIQVVAGYGTFGEAPYILTLTTALDYTTLQQAERVLVESVDDSNPDFTVLTVQRGYDGSDARDWTPTESNPVYTYMLFTAGYYNDLRDAIDFLENKPIVLEMSNVDLDIASVLTHEISVSDGLNQDAGWNVRYDFDVGTSTYSVSVNTISEYTQTSGPLNIISTDDISVTADGSIKLDSKGELILYGMNIWANDILEISSDKIRTAGSVQHDKLVKFEEGIQLADQDVLAPEPGTIRFIESGTPGFWGYYDGEWHKFGYTAQILIGQTALYYCYVDGYHALGSNPVTIKDLSGTSELFPGDSLIINDNPYTVESYDGVLMEVTLNIGLISNTNDNTPVLIVRVVDTADDGWTVRYDGSLEQWVGTNIWNVPEFSTGTATLLSHLEVGVPLPGERRNIKVSGGITIGERNTGDPLEAGTIQYRQNQYYATLMTYDELSEAWVPVEVQLLPQGAYEFLSLIDIPSTAPDGIMIRYNKAMRQWVATDEIVIDYAGTKKMYIGNDATSDIKEIVIRKPVTFLEPITWDLGLEFSERITFQDGIRVYNDPHEPISGECNIDFIPDWTSYAGGIPHGMYVWYGRPGVGSGDPIARPFHELPFIDDVTKPVGKDDRSNMMPITFAGGNGGPESAHWELRWLNIAEEGGEWRFPPRMYDPEGGYSGHQHPWRDIIESTVDLPFNFDMIELPSLDEQNGKYDIAVGLPAGPEYDHDLKYFRVRANAIQGGGWGVPHSSDLWLSEAETVTDDDVEYMRLNQSLYGDIYIRRMVTGPDPNWVGGHLVVESTIQIGELVSEEETLYPGMVRYRTGGLDPAEYPGDFQGYRCLSRDEYGTPFFSWVSLTGGLPSPTTQRLGGFLYFNGDEPEPSWEYTDDLVQRRGFFEFNLPILFHDDIYVNGEAVVAYLETGPMKVGDAPWTSDLTDPRVRDGLVRFFDESLWVYADGMWKDLLTAALVPINIPIAPTEDGVILRYDLTGAAWEATGYLRVPTTNDVIELRLPTVVSDGDLTVEEDLHVEKQLHVADRAFFAEMIRIGTPTNIEFEGLVRYNGDFEGWIPDIGWVSFTRHFEESLTSPATDVGQMLYSTQVGTHFDWVVAPGLRLLDTYMQLDRDLILGGSLVVDDFISADTLQLTSDLTVGGDLTVDDIQADVVQANTMNTGYLTVSSLATLEGLIVGESSLAAVPGGVRFKDNEFQGLYEGNVWRSFGAPDPYELFNVPREWWNRSYGDVLIDDGRGQFMLAANFNVGPRVVRMGKTLSFRDQWDINTWSTHDSNDPSRKDYHQLVIRTYMTPTDPTECTVMDQVMRISPFQGSVIWSDFDIAGDAQVRERLYVGDIAGLVDPSNLLQAYIAGSMLVAGDLEVTNDLDVDGDLSISGNLTIEGAGLIQSGEPFVLGTFDRTLDEYINSGFNWLGGDTYLEGSLNVRESIYIDDYLRVGESAAIGHFNPWGNQAVDNILHNFEVDADGNIYARKSIYCDHYLVPNLPRTPDPYYAPKGAIRYTSEGPLDIGDWEGWDGEVWRSFTESIGYIYPGFGPATEGDTLRYNSGTALWEPTAVIKNYDTHVDISAPLYTDVINVDVVSTEPTPYQVDAQTIKVQGPGYCQGLRIFVDGGGFGSGMFVEKVHSEDGNATGNTITGVVSNGSSKRAKGIFVQSVHSGVTGSAWGLQVGTVTATAGTAFGIQVQTGIAEFWEDTYTFGAMHANIDYKSINSSLVFHTTAKASAFGYDSSFKFWTAAHMSITNPSRTAVEIGGITSTYAGAVSIAYKGLNIGQINSGITNTGDSNTYGIDLALIVNNRDDTPGHTGAAHGLNMAGVQGYDDSDAIGYNLIGVHCYATGDAYGIKLGGVTSVSGTAYAIKTGLGLVDFGDDVNVTGTLTAGLFSPDRLVLTDQLVAYVPLDRLRIGQTNFATAGTGLHIEQLDAQTVAGIFIDTVNATIGNSYGLWINDITETGWGTAYAIKTGLGLVDFGEDVSVTGTLTANALAASTVSSTNATITEQLTLSIAGASSATSRISIGNTTFSTSGRAIDIGDLNTAGFALHGILIGALISTVNATGLQITSISGGSTKGIQIGNIVGSQDVTGISLSAVNTTAATYNASGLSIASTNATTGIAIGVSMGTVGATSGTAISVNLGAVTSTTGTAVGLNIGTVTAGGATADGLVIANVSGATTNYAIRTNSGLVALGDDTTIDATLTVTGSTTDANAVGIEITTVSGSTSGIGLHVNAVTGSGTENYGIYIGSVVNATENTGLFIATGTGAGNYGINSDGKINTGEHYEVDNVQVVTNRQINADFVALNPETVVYTNSWNSEYGNVSSDMTEVRALLNDILEALITHGLIATT